MSEVTETAIRKKNLAFIRKFMTGLGVTVADVAEKMNLGSVQVLYYSFKHDEMNISMICRIFDAYGYDISFSYDENGDYLDVDMILGPEQKYSEEDRSKRLFFLREMLDNGINITELAKNLRIGKTTFYYWFKQDDCHFSHLLKIAEVIGIPLKIKIRPKTVHAGD